MNKPAYLVEGDLEQKFLQSVCPGSPVKKINCNGDRVSIDAIAKRVGSLGRLLHKRYSPIVVIFDRENREESSLDIESMFLDALVPEELQVPVVVGVPDRDIESWILSDVEAFSEVSGVDSATIETPAEGLKGKSRIRRSLGNNRSYVETTDGVAWLKACRPSEMCANSLSFERLRDNLLKLDCWWLVR